MKFAYKGLTFASGADIVLNAPPASSFIKLSRVKGFFALSRTPHALLDLAGPALAALLCLGYFPSLDVVFIGLITAFSGYTAVYALNDIVDFRVDRETCRINTSCTLTADLDSVFVRHPLAQGLIGYGEALGWALFWSTLAVTGAWRLNPFCLIIFFAAAGLEILYCRLLKVTWIRTLVSGFVKTSGPIAAVFAVNPLPPSEFLLALFLWFFFWEIGGQNVPNDLSDVEGDRALQAVTIPVRFGIRISVWAIACSLIVACLLSIALPFVLSVEPSPIYLAGTVFSGLYLLLLPAMGLVRSPSPEKAFQLFNRASYYPLALLIVLTISFIKQ